MIEKKLKSPPIVHRNSKFHIKCWNSSSLLLTVSEIVNNAAFVHVNHDKLSLKLKAVTT